MTERQYPRVSVKPNVRFDVDSLALGRLLAALLTLDYYGDIVITSGSDGTHAKDSRHYRGEAIDIRTRNVPDPEGLRAKLETALGPKFRVLNEGDHLHAQVRKGGRYP